MPCLLSVAIRVQPWLSSSSLSPLATLATWRFGVQESHAEGAEGAEDAEQRKSRSGLKPGTRARNRVAPGTVRQPFGVRARSAAFDGAATTPIASPTPLTSMAPWRLDREDSHEPPRSNTNAHTHEAGSRRERPANHANRRESGRKSLKRIGGGRRGHGWGAHLIAWLGGATVCGHSGHRSRVPQEYRLLRGASVWPHPRDSGERPRSGYD